jgi:capsular polysaccharide biosynthesis protein
MANHTKSNYHPMIQVVNMINHTMGLLLAIVLSVVVVYLAHYHDIPRMFFYHGLECSGAIGGGCK